MINDRNKNIKMSCADKGGAEGEEEEDVSDAAVDAFVAVASDELTV